MARVWDLSNHAGSHLLMMLAIADFADDDGNAYPAVQTLAEKCRMKSRNANVILAALRSSGELEVRQNEGPRGTNLYRIVLAGQNLQRLTGVQCITGLQRIAPSPAKACSKPLQGLTDEPSVNHQEPSTKRETKKPSRFNAKSFLVDQGISDQLASDWLTLRKSKRAEPSKTAIEGIQHEATKAGMTLADALSMCCVRGWQGFKASWVSDGEAKPVVKVDHRPRPGDKRTRGGVPEAFDECAGWVPA